MPRLTRCGCTPARSGAGTGPASASPRRRRARRRTCASRTACCRRDRARPTRWPTPRLWLGLMRALADALPRDQPHTCRSSRPRANFVAAARQGSRRRRCGSTASSSPAARARRWTCSLPRPPRGWPRWASTTPTSSATSASIERRVRSGRHRVAVAARIARRDAAPGHEWAAAEQPDGGDGRPVSGAGRRSPTGRRELDEGGQWQHNFATRRAADVDRPRQRSPRRPARAGRQPDGLAPHPPGARRGGRRHARRAGVVPGDRCGRWPAARRDWFDDRRRRHDA